MIWFAAAGGAVVGAPCRYLLDSAVARRVGGIQPWGTLLVNLSGSAALGVFAGLLARHSITPVTFALLGTGFCGSYTTFSAFIWETLALVEERHIQRAAAHVALTIVLGIAIAYLGYRISR